MNPMNEAWTLLKGNPSMRDANDQPINHPAAMVYENLAAQMEEVVRRKMKDRQPNAPPTTSRGDEELSDAMEQLSNPTGEKRVLEGIEEKQNRMEQDWREKPHAIPRYVFGPATVKRLREARKNDQQSRDLADFLRQSARNELHNDMEHPNPETGPNYGTRLSTGTDVRMKPGNIMEQM